MTGAAALPDALDVLLVEADPLEAELVVRSLRQAVPHARIGVATDGDAALDYLLGRGTYRYRFGAPMPRLTLLSTQLPKLDGMDVLRTLRANPRASAAPVVILTSAADGREVTHAYQLGANSCVLKPVDFERFRDVIERTARYWLELNA